MILYVIEERVIYPDCKDAGFYSPYNLGKYEPYRERKEAKDWLEHYRCMSGGLCEYENHEETILSERNKEGKIVKIWKIVEKETARFKR